VRSFARALSHVRAVHRTSDDPPLACQLRHGAMHGHRTGRVLALSSRTDGSTAPGDSAPTRRRRSVAMRTSALRDLPFAEKLLSVSMSELSNDTLDRSITLRALGARFCSPFQGLGAAGVGVLCFSLTVPATRAAVPELGSLLVGAGRSVVAGALAVLVLAARRERLPARADLVSLLLVALGVVFGFPLCSAKSRSARCRQCMRS